jgi:beta-lactamase regulating signal transducer with metallopeptidase domain
MLASFVYFLVVAVLLSAAALAAERVIRLARGASRWIWLTAMIASILIPCVVSYVSIQIPGTNATPAAPAAPHAVVLREATSVHLPALTWGGPLYAAAPYMNREVDSLLRAGWMLASIVLLAALAVNGITLAARKRGWAKSTIAGIPVNIAPDLGPAIVGLLRPRIVVPRWLLTAPAGQQRWVIEHEQAHLEAGDPMLLAVAVVLVVLMPWNLPLWWQLHRLRHAIEVDCDSRVLRGRRADADAAEEYGMTLIEIGRRRSRTFGAVAAMSETRSLLERRIRIMISHPGTWLKLSAIPLAAFALGLTAVAAQITPPSTPPQQMASVPASTLDQYAGFYRFGPNMIMSVKRDGSHLITQMTAQGPVEIFPESATEFFSKAVNAQITFVQDAQGQTNSLVLHQHGQTVTAPRVDAGAAAEINSAVTARFAAQTPEPGSETALRHLVEGLISGHPDYSAMGPGLASAARAQLPRLHAGAASYGAIQSIQFLGVGKNGWDVYDVRQQHGISHWQINLDPTSGKVIGALVMPGP